jgi:hypothetical protein
MDIAASAVSALRVDVVVDEMECLVGVCGSPTRALLKRVFSDLALSDDAALHAVVVLQRPRADPLSRGEEAEEDWVAAFEATPRANR